MCRSSFLGRHCGRWWWLASLQLAEGCTDLKWLWSVLRGVLTFPKALTTVRALLCFSDGRVPPRGKKNLEFTLSRMPHSTPISNSSSRECSEVLFLVLTSFIHSASNPCSTFNARYQRPALVSPSRCSEMVEELSLLLPDGQGREL